MVKTKIRKHLWYYSTFIILLSTCLALIAFSAFNKPLQLGFIFLTAGIYIVWSLVHQFVHHTLTVKIAAEYILIGFFGVAVTFFVLH